MEPLIQAVMIYSKNIGMEFGIEKCVMLIMKSGKRQMKKGIEQPNQEKIATILKVDMRKTSTNERENRKTHAEALGLTP